MDVKVDNLAVARGGVTVLQGVSFRLAPGQALILSGPNGAGKTTLLRTLAGLQPPVSGTMNLSPEALAFATHADGLKATLTVSENLGFWAAIHGTDAVDSILETLNLAQLAPRRAAELSAGQKRRLGLARLLVTERPVWLMDEPTVSLDTATVTLVTGLIRRHLGAGGLAIIATHVDLALPEATTLDLAPHRARLVARDGFDEAFA